jgi:hypothetical protein
VGLELCGGYPGLASLERFSRPCGTGLAPNPYPALRAGLSSTVPAGLIPVRFEGWFVFSEFRPHKPIETANLDKTEAQPSLRD